MTRESDASRAASPSRTVGCRGESKPDTNSKSPGGSREGSCKGPEGSGSGGGCCCIPQSHCGKNSSEEAAFIHAPACSFRRGSPDSKEMPGNETLLSPHVTSDWESTGRTLEALDGTLQGCCSFYYCYCYYYYCIALFFLRLVVRQSVASVLKKVTAPYPSFRAERLKDQIRKPKEVKPNQMGTEKSSRRFLFCQNCCLPFGYS